MFILFFTTLLGTFLGAVKKHKGSTIWGAIKGFQTGLLVGLILLFFYAVIILLNKPMFQ